MILRGMVLAMALALAGPALALDLDMPQGARLVADRPSLMDDYLIPVAPYDGSGVPAERFEGQVSRQSWRIDNATLTTLQILAPLRAQLVAQGFDLRLDCAAIQCGGFDFRFDTEVIPAPDMYVDVRNYRFLAATRGADEAVSLLVSRSRTAGFVQVIHVVAPTAPAPETAIVAPPTDLEQILRQRGRVVLRDLDFATGDGALGDGPFPMLEALAAMLRADSDLRIALVGHTDSTGPLDTNIALSRRRAQAVRDRMIADHDLPPQQIEAEGMGYLAPIASNLTVEGREQNRRVEAIVLSAGTPRP